MTLSDICLSVAYIGPKSRTEWPRKTKISTDLAHVTWFGHHSRSKGQSHQAALLTAVLARRCGCSGGRGNVLAVGNCMLLLCRLLGGTLRFGAYGGRRGAGHIVAAARLQLVSIADIHTAIFPRYFLKIRFCIASLITPFFRFLHSKTDLL